MYQWSVLFTIVVEKRELVDYTMYVGRTINMGFEFGGIGVTDKRKELTLNRKDPLVALKDTRQSDYQVCVVLDTYYPKSLMTSFTKWVDNNIHCNYIILVATELECKAEELTQIVDYYNRNTIDFKGYLPESFTNVFYLSVGRSIYSFTGSDKLKVESFYDFIFNNTHFYSPKVQSYVFPIDFLNIIFKNFSGSWVLKDCSRAKFASLQAKYIETKNKTLDKTVPKINTHILTNRKDINNYLSSKMDYIGLMAVDTETSSLDFNKCELTCITLCSDLENAYYLDANNIDKELFNKFIENKRVVGQDYKYDYKVLHKHGFAVPMPYSDTMVLGQTLNEMRGNSLKALAYVYSKFGGYENNLDAFKKMYRPRSYKDIPVDILAPYAVMDAYVTYTIELEMQKQLTLLDNNFPVVDNGLTIRQFYEDKMMYTYREFMPIEQTGMYVDVNKLDVVSNTMQAQIEKIENEILTSFNTNKDILDLNSSKQLGIFLEQTMKWSCYGRSKNGVFSTGDEQLVLWAKEGHKEAKLMQKFRTLNTLMGMFVGSIGSEVGWREYIINHPDGTTRIHPNFGIGMAASKRNTCQNPNLQQVPSRGDFSTEIKGVISVPPKDEEGGYVFGTLDYASLQIRLCALDSEDKFLCNLYKTEDDPDLHSTTAYELIKDASYNFIQIKDGDRDYEFYETQMIKIIRDGAKMEIMAREIKETDTLNI